MSALQSSAYYQLNRSHPSWPGFLHGLRSSQTLYNSRAFRGGEFSHSSSAAKSSSAALLRWPLPCVGDGDDPDHSGNLVDAVMHPIGNARHLEGAGRPLRQGGPRRGFWASCAVASRMRATTRRAARGLSGRCRRGCRCRRGRRGRRGRPSFHAEFLHAHPPAVLPGRHRAGAAPRPVRRRASRHSPPRSSPAGPAGSRAGRCRRPRVFVARSSARNVGRDAGSRNGFTPTTPSNSRHSRLLMPESSCVTASPFSIRRRQSTAWRDSDDAAETVILEGLIGERHPVLHQRGDRSA